MPDWGRSEILAPMKPANLTSAVDLFGKSYGLVRKNLNIYALVYFVPAAMVIAGVIQLIADNQRRGWDWGHAFSSSFLGPNVGSGSSIQAASAILSIILLFGAIVSYLLAIVLNLRVAQDKKPTFRSTWFEVTRDWLWARLLGLGILTVLMLIVGFIYSRPYLQQIFEFYKNVYQILPSLSETSSPTSPPFNFQNIDPTIINQSQKVLKK